MTAHVSVWDASFLCEMYRPGSQGDDWTWADEAADRLREAPEKLAALVEDVAANGIREPVLLGHDGRVWDGHHRILAALLTGRSVPSVRAAQTGAGAVHPEASASVSGAAPAPDKPRSRLRRVRRLLPRPLDGRCPMTAHDEAVEAAADALEARARTYGLNGTETEALAEAAVAAAAPILLAAERQRIAAAIRAHAKYVEESGWGRAVEFRTAARIAEAAP